MGGNFDQVELDLGTTVKWLEVQAGPYSKSSRSDCLGERKRESGWWYINTFPREERVKPKLEEAGPGISIAVEQKFGKMGKGQTAKESKHQIEKFRFYCIDNGKTKIFK